MSNILKDNGVVSKDGEEQRPAELLAEAIAKGVASSIAEIRERAIVYSDQQKAKLKQAAMAAAGAAFDNLKKQIKDAQAMQQKLNSKKNYYAQAAMRATDDAKKTSFEAKVTELEGLIQEQADIAAAGLKKVGRMEESKKNNELAAGVSNAIAKERQESKEFSESLRKQQNEARTKIKTRTKFRDAKQKAADKLRYSAEVELDDEVQKGKYAAYTKAQAEVDAVDEELAETADLIITIGDNILQVRDTFRVRNADLLAQKAVAELAVAIKGNMNADTESKTNETTIKTVTEKLAKEVDAAKKKKFQARIDRLTKANKEIAAGKAERGKKINELAKARAAANAAKVVVQAKIAAEGAQRDVNRARQAKNRTAEMLETLQGEVGGLEVEVQMAEDDNEAKRIKAQMAKITANMKEI